MFLTGELLLSTPIGSRKFIHDSILTSSGGLIPRAKIKTIKMTLVIVLGNVETKGILNKYLNNEKNVYLLLFFFQPSFCAGVRFSYSTFWMCMDTSG